MQKYVKSPVFFLLSVFFVSCEESLYELKLEEEEISLEIQRFEHDFFQLREWNEQQYKEMVERDSQVFTVFTALVLEVGYPSQPRTIGFLKNAATDPYWWEVYQKSQTLFNDFSPTERELSKAFAYYGHYFPEDTIPKVVTFVKGINFERQIFTYDDFLGICLDLYLGQDFPYYPSVYPKFLYRTFEPDYIPVDAMRTMFTKKYSEEEFRGKSVLAQMIYEGKKQLFLNMTLPNQPDSIKFSYTEEQMGWLTTYEKEVWTALLDEDVLFETEHAIAERFFTDGPFTNAPGLPQKTPPRVGAYFGLRILEAYLRKYPETSFVELLEMKDEQKIFQKSSYRPR